MMTETTTYMISRVDIHSFTFNQAPHFSKISQSHSNDELSLLKCFHQPGFVTLSEPPSKRLQRCLASLQTTHISHDKMPHNITKKRFVPYSWRTSLLPNHTSALSQQSPSLCQIGRHHCKQYTIHSVQTTMSHKCDEQEVDVELLIYIILCFHISSFLQQIFNHW